MTPNKSFMIIFGAILKENIYLALGQFKNVKISLIEKTIIPSSSKQKVFFFMGKKDMGNYLFPSTMHCVLGNSEFPISFSFIYNVIN
jgi:hypothetical protein